MRLTAEERYRKLLHKKDENHKLYDEAMKKYKKRTQDAATSGSKIALLIPNKDLLGRGKRVKHPPKTFAVSEPNPCTPT